MSLDKIDLKLIEELEDDARQPVQALARKLGMKRTTVLNRLNRLKAAGILKIECVVNTDLLGYQFLLLIGINVFPGKAGAVANQLVPLQGIKIVCLTSGKYDILAWALFRDRSAFSHFITHDLEGIPDITTTEVMHSLQRVKNACGYLKPQTEPSGTYQGNNPSALDVSIINALQSEPRQPITELARATGCSMSVAKARLEKLMNDGIIGFACIVDPKGLKYEISVIILIKSKTDKVCAVANELLLLQNTVTHVSLFTGQWQILVRAQFEDKGHMYDFLLETLHPIPGIIASEVVHLIKFPKYHTNFQD